MAVASIPCVMCNQTKLRGRWPDGFWAQDCCADCVEMMCRKIVDFRSKQEVKEAREKGQLPF